MNIQRLKELANKYPLIYAALYPAMVMREPFVKWRWRLQEEVLKNLSSVLAEDPVIRIKEFNGIFTIDSHSDLFSRVVLTLEYEPRLVDICQQYLDKDKDVIDVGANVGFYTVMLAKSLNKGRVISIEPTPNALRRLKKNVVMNQVSNKVEIFEGVASNAMGTIEINTIEGKEEYSSISAVQHREVSSLVQTSVKVNSTTLDELVKQKSLNPGFIKIDVEGAENLVFEGAKEVLREKRPVILSELTDVFLKANGSSAKDVCDFIRKYDYEVFDVGNTTAQQVRKNEFDHILCTPKELGIKMK